MGYSSIYEYCLNGGWLGFNPNDSTAYMGAHLGLAMSTANIRQMTVPRAGVIRRIYVYTYASTTAGTGEDMDLKLRVNDTTDYDIATVGAAAAERKFENTALNIPVSAGDTITFKITTPAWVTNPENWYGVGSIIVTTA